MSDYENILKSVCDSVSNAMSDELDTSYADIIKKLNESYDLINTKGLNAMKSSVEEKIGASYSEMFNFVVNNICKLAVDEVLTNPQCKINYYSNKSILPDGKYIDIVIRTTSRTSDGETSATVRYYEDGTLWLLKDSMVALPKRLKSDDECSNNETVHRIKYNKLLTCCDEDGKALCDTPLNEYKCKTLSQAVSVVSGGSTQPCSVMNGICFLMYSLIQSKKDFEEAYRIKDMLVDENLYNHLIYTGGSPDGSYVKNLVKDGKVDMFLLK